MVAFGGFNVSWILSFCPPHGNDKMMQTSEGDRQRFLFPVSEATTARAENLTGTLTQPVFNDQHGVDPGPPLRHPLLSQSPLPHFFGKQEIVYQASHLNFM